jgi:hypothetical protein
VNVERQPGRLTQIRDHLRAKCEVWDEVTIHDVDVDPVSAGLFDGDDGLSEPGEVGREDGRSELRFSHV